MDYYIQNLWKERVDNGTVSSGFARATNLTATAMKGTTPKQFVLYYKFNTGKTIVNKCRLPELNNHRLSDLSEESSWKYMNRFQA
jgi:hypothetical protein